DTFQKTFDQVRILNHSLPQDHYARVRILDTELIEIGQFPKGGFPRNEQIGYRTSQPRRRHRALTPADRDKVRRLVKASRRDPEQVRTYCAARISPSHLDTPLAFPSPRFYPSDLQHF